MEAAAVARNHGMRLAGIEDHHRAPGQRYTQACGGEVHIQPTVLAEEQITEGGTAIVGCVVVVLGATAGHQGHVARDQHVVQPQRAGPFGHGLHAELVVGPAHARTRQGQDIDVA